LAIAWGFGFALAVSAVLLMAGPQLIALMTTSADVRAEAQRFLVFAVVAPVMGVLAFTFDGIYIGATWARDMRNLMLVSLAIYFLVWWALQPLGNAGLWLSLLILLLTRGALQGLRYPSLLRSTF
jgi:MATE family multidrug resistance protein